MKRFLPFLSIVLIMAACNSKPTETQTLQASKPALADTAGLAQFQQWKTQNELTVADIPDPLPSPVKEVTVVKEVRVERSAPVRKQTASVRRTQTPVPQTTSENSSTGNERTVNTGSANTGSDPVAPGEQAQKEGWSKAAKGAAIGGAGGAVIGAIINKRNPAVGAVIGGVLGGAVGYGVGRSKDKKDGRY